MTQLFTGVLLALAALSLGLRTTSVLVPRMQPLIRLLISSIIGTALVMGTLQISDSYSVHDLGLGLLVSLAPVGVFDLVKWWYRYRRPSVRPPR